MSPKQGLHKSAQIAIALLLCAWAVGAAAADYKPLDAQYTMGGKTFHDPPVSEAQDTHLYLALTGSAAKDLYIAMKAKARRDQCVADGSMTKRLGEMQCTRSADGAEYRCWFGIDIKHQRITNGVIC